VTYKATKVVIITEKIIFDGVAEIIEEAGGTGYTVVAAGGKGSRGVRPTNRASVVDAFRNVKVEVIVSSHEIAEQITDRVAARYFDDYSGITYLEDVEILRPHKFHH
jgi:nitrogen regulatory protein PII